MKGFTKKEAAEISELAMRSVQYFTERGLVEPEIDPGEGKGSTRVYSMKNLVELEIIRSLAIYGMSFPVIKRLMSLSKDIIAEWDQIVGPAYLCFYPQKEGFKLNLYVGMITSNIFNENDLKGSCLIIDLGKTVRKVQHIIEIEETVGFKATVEAQVIRGGGA